jgi:prepilin-type N-terminal cleavage/methylation domain-containing protein
MPYSVSRRSGREIRIGSFAFTLIELLVVVVVIGVLASLLLPALARAKSSAKSAKCKINLRQNLLALKMYVDDHSEYPFLRSPWTVWNRDHKPHREAPARMDN